MAAEVAKNKVRFTYCSGKIANVNHLWNIGLKMFDFRSLSLFTLRDEKQKWWLLIQKEFWNINYIILAQAFQT